MLELYVGVYLLGVLISSVSQVLLKKAAMRQYETPLKEYLNPWVITAYALFFGATLMTILLQGSAAFHGRYIGGHRLPVHHVLRCDDFQRKAG